MTETTTPSISTQLKEGCADLHQAAEMADLPKRMLKGDIGKEEYASLLEQSYLLNKALDEAIVRRRADVPALLNLVTEEQLQAPRLEADLRSLGMDPAQAAPTPETAEAIAVVERAADEAPLRLFGLHYVREGANNGNRFLAMKIGPGLGLTTASGLANLDPYGEEQPQKWAAFKTALDAHPFTDEERATLVDAARDMFRAVTGLHRSVPGAAAARGA